jgi:hypothetical protein
MFSSAAFNGQRCHFLLLLYDLQNGHYRPTSRVAFSSYYWCDFGYELDELCLHSLGMVDDLAISIRMPSPMDIDQYCGRFYYLFIYKKNYFIS